MGACLLKFEQILLSVWQLLSLMSNDRKRGKLNLGFSMVSTLASFDGSNLEYSFGEVFGYALVVYLAEPNLHLL